MQIGLLEDDIAIQEMLRLILQEEGHSVTIYPTADACLQALITPTLDQIEGAFDLLIVDWRLAGQVHGTEVIRQVRSHPQYHSLPIILTTAATFIDPESLDNLDVALLEKPFSVDEIIGLINSLV